MVKIKCGEALMELKRPFVHCLDKKYKNIYCDFCLIENTKKSNASKSSKLLKCSSCKCMFYCNGQCQKNDWSIHKTECRYFASTAADIDDQMIRLFFRILIRVGVNGEIGVLDEVGLKTFETLVDHYQDVKNDVARMSVFLKCVETLKRLAGSEFFSRFNSKDLISYFGKMVINSFSISNFDLSKSIGTGIYLSAASLDHSCAPNCVIVYDGARMFVKSIQEFDTEKDKPFVSYIDEIMEKNARKEYFIRNYYFSCKCQMCSSKKCDQNDLSHLIIDDAAAIKCIHCEEEDSLIYDNRLNEYKCLNCGHVGNNERRETKTRFENSKKLLDNFNLWNLNESRVNLIEEELKKATELGLHKLDDSEPSWVNFVKLSELLMEHYITNGNDQKASLIATQNLCDNYIKYYPKNHPAIGFLFIKVAKLLANLTEISRAKEYFEKANQILQIVYNNTGNQRVFTCLDELNMCISMKNHD